MMKVLISAYSCSPNRGSEPGVGWNWCSNLANYCELYIITEGHWKENIESELPKVVQGKNMHFHYIWVTDNVREMAHNQGDWRFYWYYHKWQKQALKLAESICKEHDIDILHQLNLTGFREPGLLYKIKKPIVWGPVGGMEFVPISYLRGAGIKLIAFNVIKNAISTLQFRYQSSVRRMMKKADAIVTATSIGQRKIKDCYKREVDFINENGCSIIEVHAKERKETNQLDLIWCGKFDFRKRLDIALKTIAELKDLNIKLHIVGLGEGKQYEQLSKELGIEDYVEWHWVGHDMVNTLMRMADLLFFTSISDATSSTVMEAIQNGTPVVCFDACGFGTVVDDSIGVKVPLSNPKQSVNDFAKVIRKLYNNREKIQQMSFNCKERISLFTWENEAKRMIEIYERVLKQNE